MTAAERQAAVESRPIESPALERFRQLCVEAERRRLTRMAEREKE